MKKKIYVVLFVIIIAALCLSTLTACGANGNDYAPGGSSSDVSEDKSESVVDNVNRKIYYKVYVELTGGNPETIGSTVRTQTTAKGGYVESSSETFSEGSASYYRYTVRIPTKKLDEFVAAIEGAGKLGSKRIETVDITTGYVNAQARKEALESEREVLNELMHSDGVTVADVLTISQRISEINANLNSLEIQLTQYDSLIDFSTVTIYISQPETVSVAAIVVPILVALVIIAVIVGVIVYKKGKKMLKAFDEGKDEEKDEKK